MPPPNQYQEPRDWKKEMTDYSYGGSPLKGKFLKGDKITLSAEVIKNSKKEGLPGPGTYDSNLKKNPRGLSKVNEQKGQYIDDAKFIGLQTPGAIYNTDVTYIKPKILTTKVYPDKRAQYL
eukprot:403355986